MENRRIEYEVAMSVYRQQQRELQAHVYRMLGNHGAPKQSRKQLRRQIAKQLGGMSVSKMIIEAR